MANLVPLHIDKDTGKLVAKPITTTGGGGGGPPTGASGYIHEQPSASTTWTITHNQESTNLICQVYTLSGEMILPNSLTIVNINTVQITFAVPQDGSAHIVFFTTA